MSAARISEGNTTLNNKILMVMPWRAYVRKATEEGFRVFSIWDPERIPDDHREEVARYSEELLFTDFRDVAGLRRLVAGTAIRLGVAHVLHLGNEDTQLPVCEEAHAHGLALNPPEALRVINDKTAMRQLLRERGLSPVRATAAASAHEVRSLLSRLELPVVAKPALLSGSRGVRLVHEARDLDEWEEQLADQRYTGPVLIEEYLRGPEFSVETLTAQGTHHLVGITSKRKTPPPGFTEIAHVHPASLTEPDRAAVADLVVRFLDEAGYRFGPAHTEVILTADGPRIVESQTRAPGDRIHRAIALASGYDIEAAMFRALMRQAGPGEHRSSGGVCLLLPAPARAARVCGGAGRHPGAAVRARTEVPLRTGRHGPGDQELREAGTVMSSSTPRPKRKWTAGSPLCARCCAPRRTPVSRTGRGTPRRPGRDWADRGVLGGGATGRPRAPVPGLVPVATSRRGVRRGRCPR